MSVAIAWLRWAGVATMLLIVLAWPYYGRDGQTLLPFVGAFALYNGLVALLRQTVPRLHSWRWVPWLDLPVATTLFYLDFEPGGPLFLSFFIGVSTAALAWPLRAVVLYVAAVGGAVAVVATTLPGWTASPLDLRQLAARIAVLAGVGIGAALLRRQLARETARAQASRDETARLAALEQARAEFIGSISHDLKTPLTAAQAGLGMLAQSGAARLHPEERELLGSAHRSVQRLGVLIDDLLASGQLAAGTLRLALAPLDLREVVERALATMHPLLRQKEQPLTVDLPAPLPVAGDAPRLEQVVVNLLANASQHTPAGTRITVSGAVVEGEARLTAADNGPGIPHEELAALFRRFYRPGATHQPGSGMGLLIARNLVELHGGRIWAESTPGRGSVFHIALPQRQEQEREQEQEQETEAS
jgi:signal transduction histidine kinase